VGELKVGQARLKRDVFRQTLLKKNEEWNFPPSQWEASVCSELREEDVVLVRRVPIEELARIGMPAYECHANARWFEKNYRFGTARAVVGWWVQWPNFVLHSVVELEGMLICVTPSLTNEAEIPFIPDPKISWIEDGKVYSAIRSGQIMGWAIRKYPAFTMALSAIVRERLLAGCDPYKAGDFADRELEELRRRYIPMPTRGS
jgi:hypothetical protein